MSEPTYTAEEYKTALMIASVRIAEDEKSLSGYALSPDEIFQHCLAKACQ